MAEITARFVYSEAEALRAASEMTHAVFPMARRLPWLGALIFVGTLGFGYSTDRGLSGLLLGLICGGVLMALPLLTRRQVRKQFHQNPSRDRPITWKFSAHALANETEGAAGSFTWKLLVDVQERGEAFLLFSQPRLAHWVPKHAFGSANDVEAFRCLIRENASKFSGGKLGPGNKPQPSSRSRWIAYSLMTLATISMAATEFWKSGDWVNAFPTAAIPPIVAGMVILISSLFAENRNPRTRTKIIAWVAVAFIATAFLRFQG